MATAVSMQLSHVASSLRLTNGGLARLFRASPSSVRRWRHGDASPTAERIHRLYELTVVSDLLSQVMEPDAGAAWLQRSNQFLDGESPAERIARGGYRDVLGLIQALGEGVVV